jgi:hypothetical protein
MGEVAPPPLDEVQFNLKFELARFVTVTELGVAGHVTELPVNGEAELYAGPFKQAVLLKANTV